MSVVLAKIYCAISVTWICCCVLSPIDLDEGFGVLFLHMLLHIVMQYVM